jgi:hypothetical protein
MASSKSGICCVCGKQGKLSFEHLPPEKAFNDNAILLAKIEVVRSGGHPDNYEEGAGKQQRGSGKHTLCEPCNSSTGNWYAPHYVDLAKQGMELLMAVRYVSARFGSGCQFCRSTRFIRETTATAIRYLKRRSRTLLRDKAWLRSD